MTSESLWSCYKDETYGVDNNDSDGKSFKYKSKIKGKTETKPAQPAQTAPDQDGIQLP